MEIASRTGYINNSRQEVFDYLSDLNNYRELLPADQISDWQSDSDSCSFKIKGATNIGFVKKSSDPYSRIDLVSSDNTPIDFELTILLSEADGKTEGNIKFISNVNPFLRMMIEKPLKNLFGMMIDNMERKFN
jgi:carbon monoxide dehydrogenase subunit G